MQFQRRSSQERSEILPEIWEPVDHLQGSLGPSGPETPKKAENSLPPESGKSLSKKSGESGKSLEKVPKDFSRLFPPGPDAPRDFFGLFGVFGCGGPRDPVNGQRAPNQRFQEFPSGPEEASRGRKSKDLASL